MKDGLNQKTERTGKKCDSNFSAEFSHCNGNWVDLSDVPPCAKAFLSDKWPSHFNLSFHYE